MAKRRIYQFRWRTLFLAIGIFSAVCGVLTLKWRVEHEREATWQALNAFGGSVDWRHSPWWSSRVKRVDFAPWGFFKGWATYRGEGINDDQLAQLKCHLEYLEILHLDGTEVTDAGMQHLREMRHLKILTLTATVITDSGLEHLAHLPQLERLGLDSTGIEDRELAQWGGRFPRNQLKPYQSRVTDKGLAWGVKHCGFASTFWYWSRLRFLFHGPCFCCETLLA